jgi:hypothetical protein
MCLTRLDAANRDERMGKMSGRRGVEEQRTYRWRFDRNLSSIRRFNTRRVPL